MSDQMDKLLEELQQERLDKQNAEPTSEQEQVPAKTAAAPKGAFVLNLDLDGEFGEYRPESAVKPEPESPAAAPIEVENAGTTAEAEAVAEDETVHTTEQAVQVAPVKSAAKKSSTWQRWKQQYTNWKKENEQYRNLFGCLKWLIYATVIVLVSGVLSFFIVTGIIDVSGLNKSYTEITVTIPQGASTETIANILHKNGLIDQPLLFRLYSKFSKADGSYSFGEFELYPHMGYEGLVEALQGSSNGYTVWVTIPEGYTVDKIASLMEAKEVCTAEEFYTAVLEGEFNYDFLQDIPTAEDDEAYADRIYRLEGYLFPDTYEFYIGDEPGRVIRKMLDAFDSQIDERLRTAIADKGMTLNEAVILASLIQGEAASFSDMQGVSRVLLNRLDEDSPYSKLELCSTRDYIAALKQPINEQTIVPEAYNTYLKTGLPVGAINNPGKDAFEALIAPSEHEDLLDCYFFATDYDTGITYFSDTYEEHEAICKQYGIGMYG